MSYKEFEKFANVKSRLIACLDVFYALYVDYRNSDLPRLRHGFESRVYFYRKTINNAYNEAGYDLYANITTVVWVCTSVSAIEEYAATCIDRLDKLSIFNTQFDMFDHIIRNLLFPYAKDMNSLLTEWRELQDHLNDI